MYSGIIKPKNNRGTALMVALIFLVALSMMSAVFVSNLISSSNFELSFETQSKSFYIAEAGVEHAVWKLTQSGNRYDGESGVPFGEGYFDVIVKDHSALSNAKLIISSAQLSGYPENRTLQQVRAIVILRETEEGRFEVSRRSWERPD